MRFYTKYFMCFEKFKNKIDFSFQKKNIFSQHPQTYKKTHTSQNKSRWKKVTFHPA